MTRDRPRQPHYQIPPRIWGGAVVFDPPGQIEPLVTLPLSAILLQLAEEMSDPAEEMSDPATEPRSPQEG